MVDDDVLVRRHGKPDMDLKAGSVPMLVARRDHCDAAGGGAPMAGFEALDVVEDLRAGGVRGFRTFKGDLRVNLHECLSGATHCGRGTWSALLTRSSPTHSIRSCSDT